MDKPLQLTLVQANLIWEKPDENRTHLEKLLQNYSGEGLILFPEMFTSGFTMNPEKVAEAPEGPTWEWLKNLAVSKNSFVGGSYVILENENYFNRFVIAGPTGEQFFYNKRHLFNLGGENLSYTPGKDKIIVSMYGWKVLLQICYDLRFPVFVRNKSEGEEKYDLALYVANWPEARMAHWNVLLQARAIENQAIVAGINRAGKDDYGLNYTGGTGIFLPNGEILKQSGNEEEIISAELNGKWLNEYREKLPFLKDGDDFQLLKT